MAETNGVTALVPRPITPPPTYTQRDFVRWQIVGDDVTADEFDYFIAVARHVNLDPLRRQIYCVKRGSKAVVQTGIDGYRALAARTGQLAGIDDAEYGPEEGKHPTWAKVTVWRMVAGQRCPSSATARWAEYKPERSPMWEKMPFLMLAKCAESLALRKAFPGELSGVYTDAEMMQADQPDQAPAEPDSCQPPAGQSWKTYALELAKETGVADKDQLIKDVLKLTGVDLSKQAMKESGWEKVARHFYPLAIATREEGAQEASDVA